MPRAGVHARRDRDPVARALRIAGLLPPPDLLAQLRSRHRAIDSNQSMEDQELHFMRGPDSEDAGRAMGEALDHGWTRARRAADALAAARERGSAGAVREAVRALADVCHMVRDSYSKGHALRAPGQGGPRVVAIKAWKAESDARGGFGLRHALLHDIRFEVPFAWFAPEVPASDRAVRLATDAVANAALRDAGEAREARLRAGFQALVDGFFRAAESGPGAPREPERDADHAAAVREGQRRPQPQRHRGGGGLPRP